MWEEYKRNSIQILSFLPETRVDFYTKTHQADFFQIHRGEGY